MQKENHRHIKRKFFSQFRKSLEDLVLSLMTFKNFYDV